MSQPGDSLQLEIKKPHKAVGREQVKRAVSVFALCRLQHMEKRFDFVECLNWEEIFCQFGMLLPAFLSIPGTDKAPAWILLQGQHRQFILY